MIVRRPNSTYLYTLKDTYSASDRFTRFVYIFRDYYKNVLSYIVLQIWLYCLYKFTSLYFNSN